MNPPMLLLIILAALVIVVGFQNHLINLAMSNTRMALETAKTSTIAADAWKKLAQDIVAMGHAQNTIIATLDGYDIEVLHFNSDDEREARRMLTDFKKNFLAGQALKKAKGTTH